MKKIHVIILFLMSVLALPAYGQLKLVQESFKQISNTDAANPNEWGDIDAQLLTRDDRTDENGVKNALLKLKVDKITQEDMERLEFIADQGIFVKWIQQGNTPGEMWLLVTGMNTSFMVRHPIFGESNSVHLNLKGLCSYEMELTNNETTTLTILSEPVGANIYLDGNWMGYAGEDGCIIRQVSFGKHRLTASLDEVTDELDIEVSEGSQRSYKLEVFKERTFTINSDPAGAAILVDGENVGTSPVTIPLKLKYHKIEAQLAGQYDKFEALFDENMSNTINLTVVKHKQVQIAAMQSGRNISASVHIDDQVVGVTPHTADIPYGQHDLLVSYYSKTKKKRIKVDDDSPTYYRFKFKAGNSFTWPWEKDYNVRPVGLSLAFVQKTWQVTTKNEGGGENHTKVDFWDEGKTVPGIQAGLRIQPHFGLGFGLSSGLFYEYYWDKSEDMTDEYGTYHGLYQEHVLYVPLCLEYRLFLGENFSLFVNGGISMDVSMASHVKLFNEGETEAYYTDSELYDAYDISPRRFNLYYEFGGGLQIYGLQLSFNTAKALLSRAGEQENVSVKINKPMMVSIAYVFGGE